MTKVLVLVDPKVTAGLNKGGEDLDLVLTAEVEGDAPPENPEWELALSVCDADGLNVSWDEDEDFDETHTKTHEVRYCTWHYEIEWTGTGASLLEEKDYDGTVREKLDQAEWEFCHKPGEPSRLRLEVEWCAGGNAD